MSNYKSKHTGAQVDEAVSKVLNGDIEGSNIKDGSIPMSALDDKSNIHLKDWGMYDYVGKLGEGVLELPLNYHQCIIYDNTTKKLYQIMSGQRVTLQPLPAVIVKYNGSVVTLYDPDNVYSNYQIFVYKGIKTINDAYLPDIETPTPDWNAQVGDAGYIENKPFGDTRILGEISIDSTEPLMRSVNYNIPINEFDTIKMYYSDGYTDWINLQIDMQNKPKYGVRIGSASESPIGDFEIWYYEDSDYIQLAVIPSSIPGDEDIFSIMGADYILNDCIVEGIKKLPTQYLPIDPVVWKYMCNPYTIIPSTEIPIDLHNIIYDATNGKLKQSIINFANIKPFSDNAQLDGIYSFYKVNSNAIYINVSEQGVYMYQYNPQTRKFEEYS